MINQVKIGQFIAESRKNRNLTQKQLAEEIGVTDKTISKWETGNRLPDAALLMDLCSVLQVDVNELLRGERVSPENYRQDAKDNLVDLVGEINVIKQEKKGRYVGAILGILSVVWAIAMVMAMSLGTAGLPYFIDLTTLCFLMGIICLILAATGCFHDFVGAWKVCILHQRISGKRDQSRSPGSFFCLSCDIDRRSNHIRHRDCLCRRTYGRDRQPWPRPGTDGALCALHCLVGIDSCSSPL